MTDGGDRVNPYAMPPLSDRQQRWRRRISVVGFYLFVVDVCLGLGGFTIARDSLTPAYVQPWGGTLMGVLAVLALVTLVVAGWAKVTLSSRSGPRAVGPPWPMAQVSVAARVLAIFPMFWLLALVFALGDVLPAWLLGPSPARATLVSASSHVPSCSRCSDTADGTFMTPAGQIRARLPGPPYDARPGMAVVYDPASPGKAMLERDWVNGRASSWRVFFVLGLGGVAVAYGLTVVQAQRATFGRLRPGLPVTQVALFVGKVPAVEVEYSDTSVIRYLDTEQFREALRKKIADDGNFEMLAALKAIEGGR